MLAPRTLHAEPPSSLTVERCAERSLPSRQGSRNGPDDQERQTLPATYSWPSKVIDPGSPRGSAAGVASLGTGSSDTKLEGNGAPCTHSVVKTLFNARSVLTYWTEFLPVTP